VTNTTEPNIVLPRAEFADELSLVATVAHELRGPLTPLKGYMLSLSQGTLADTPETRRDCYDAMLRQVDRLERLIDDLLDVAQIERGTVRLEQRYFDLRSTLAEQVVAIRAAHPDRETRLGLPPEPIPVRTDPLRVSQVVSNLLTNAVKYSPSGTPVDISVSCGGRMALVTVRDHGDGIPAADQSRIFERFHRIDNDTTQHATGSGVGLFVAKQLVEAIGGRMWVDSMPGYGATFAFTVPLAQLHEEQREPDEPAHAPMLILGDNALAPVVSVGSLRETGPNPTGEAEHGEGEDEQGIEGHHRHS
jgi:signal transduction histidine kinase